jgi:hypothetical protein
MRIAAAVAILLLGCGGGAAAPDAWVDPRPDGAPCTADCECGSSSACCMGTPQGECVAQCGRLDFGFCGYDCPCAGGTCDDRHCCVLPDGAIDNGFGAACTAPDAGDAVDAAP